MPARTCVEFGHTTPTLAATGAGAAADASLPSLSGNGQRVAFLKGGQAWTRDLATGTATRDTHVNCTGVFRLGGWVYRDLKAYGTLDFITGVAKSCNVFFWQAGQEVEEMRRKNAVPLNRAPARAPSAPSRCFRPRNAAAWCLKIFASRSPRTPSATPSSSSAAA